MLYTIATNATFDSREVTFDGKPAEAVRAALKALRMRWNPKRALWYGFAAEDEIKAAIQAAQPAEEPAQITQPGYLGATAISGAKADRYLHGAELAAAIRADIKAAGIKGVSVRINSRSITDAITATITATSADLVPLADYVAAYRPAGRNWIDLGNSESVPLATYYDCWNAQAAGHAAGYIPKIQRQAAETEYGFSACIGCHQINQYHIAKYTEYTPAFLAKLDAVNNIIANYNYDDSNAMVDYFDTNFYWYLNVKIV